MRRWKFPLVIIALSFSYLGFRPNKKNSLITKIHPNETRLAKESPNEQRVPTKRLGLKDNLGNSLQESSLKEAPKTVNQKILSKEKLVGLIEAQNRNTKRCNDVIENKKIDILFMIKEVSETCIGIEDIKIYIKSLASSELNQVYNKESVHLKWVDINNRLQESSSDMDKETAEKMIPMLENGVMKASVMIEFFILAENLLNLYRMTDHRGAFDLQRILREAQDETDQISFNLPAQEPTRQEQGISIKNELASLKSFKNKVRSLFRQYRTH